MGYLKNALCFFHSSPEAFGRSQWPMSQVTYIYYRYIFAFYVIGWDMLITIRGSFQYGAWYQVDFMVWTFHLLSLYSFISVVSALVDWVRVSRWRYDAFLHKESTATTDNVLSTSRSTLGVGPEYSIYRSVPWNYKLDWMLFNLNVSMNPIAAILYFVSKIGHHPIQGDDTFSDIIIVHLTIVNTCLILVDMFVRRIPIRIVHAVYPMALWVIYVTVNAVVQSTMDIDSSKPEAILYPAIFNWESDDIAKPIGYSLGFLCGVFVIHVFAFVLYSLRKTLANRCVGDLENSDHSDISSEAIYHTPPGLCCSVCGRGRESHDVVFS